MGTQSLWLCRSRRGGERKLRGKNIEYGCGLVEELVLGSLFFLDLDHFIVEVVIGPSMSSMDLNHFVLEVGPSNRVIGRLRSANRLRYNRIM